MSFRSSSTGLKGSVQAAPSGSPGFDTDTKLTSSTAEAFVKAGFKFAIRYLSLSATEAAGDLTTQEAQEILEAGLALMAVQHVPEPGWYPTQELGQQYGQYASGNAQTVGLPAGVNVWLDLEGVNSGASASDVSAYCNAWFGVVSGAKYVPGLYVGAGAILDNDQLAALDVQYYWKSGSNSGSQQPGSCFEYSYPANGYCMVQSISSSDEIDGVTYDGDVVQADNCGNTPLWLTEQARRFKSAPSSATPARSSQVSFSSSKSRSVAIAMVAILAGILLYAAGVVTGPILLPAIQSRSATAAKPASTAANAALP
jgi:hypothetical protein